MSRDRRTSPSQRAPGPRAVSYWYGAMALGGFAFGLLGERRPLGDDVLAHPLVMFFFVVGLSLLLLRLVLARPVPEVIPERPLLLGCFSGLGGFLLGNAFSAYLLAG